jgi:hypothetical protein
MDFLKRMRGAVIAAGLLLGGGTRLSGEINFVGASAEDTAFQELFKAAMERIREIDPGNSALDYLRRHGKPNYVWDIDLDINRLEGYGYAGFVRDGNDMTITALPVMYMSLDEIFVHEALHIRDASGDYELFLLAKYFRNLSPRYIIIGTMLQEAVAYTGEFMYRRRINGYLGRKDPYLVRTKYSAGSPKPRMTQYYHPFEFWRHLEEWHKAQSQRGGAEDNDALYEAALVDFFRDFINNHPYLDQSLEQVYYLNSFGVASDIRGSTFMLGGSSRDLHSKKAIYALFDEYTRRRVPPGIFRPLAEDWDAALDVALKDSSAEPSRRPRSHGESSRRTGSPGQLLLEKAEKAFTSNRARYNDKYGGSSGPAETAPLSASTVSGKPLRGNDGMTPGSPFGDIGGDLTAKEIADLRALLSRVTAELPQ